MTQYYYLAAPGELKTGEFGANPVSPDQPNVFQTELDFAHVFFQGNVDSATGIRKCFSSHLSFQHQVVIPYGLGTKRWTKATAENEKLYGILYNYIEAALQEQGVVEWFTCWCGEEEELLEHIKEVQWKEIRNPLQLALRDRELWVIRL